MNRDEQLKRAIELLEIALGHVECFVDFEAGTLEGVSARRDANEIKAFIEAQKDRES